MIDGSRQNRWREHHPERAEEIRLNQDRNRKESGYYTTDEYRERHNKNAQKLRTKNRKQISEYNKERRLQAKIKAEKLLGNKCFVCGKNKFLRYHKKDGIYHKSSETVFMVIKNPDDFVRLCEFCHKGVHFSMKYYGWTWEQVVENLLYKKPINSNTEI